MAGVGFKGCEALCEGLPRRQVAPTCTAEYVSVLNTMHQYATWHPVALRLHSKDKRLHRHHVPPVSPNLQMPPALNSSHHCGRRQVRLSKGRGAADGEGARAGTGVCCSSLQPSSASVAAHIPWLIPKAGAFQKPDSKQRSRNRYNQDTELCFPPWHTGCVSH